MTVRRILPNKRSLGFASSSIMISQSKSGLGSINKNLETETSIDVFIEQCYNFYCILWGPRYTSINIFEVEVCSLLSFYLGLTIDSTLSTHDFTKIFELFRGLRSTISSYSPKAEVWFILELDLYDFYKSSCIDLISLFNYFTFNRLESEEIRVFESLFNNWTTPSGVWFELSWTMLYLDGGFFESKKGKVYLINDPSLFKTSSSLFKLVIYLFIILYTFEFCKWQEWFFEELID